MSGIIPIPTTRVGDLFVRQRLAGRVQTDQLALFQLQNQISTGQRLQLPSDDAPAALRAINLQRLLDRKGQIRTNLQASNQYLSGADARLASIATGLSELRGSVISVAGNVVPESARQAVAQDVESLLQELVTAGNAKMGGRYLFSGSRSQSQPYDYNGTFVEYSGNDGVLRNYVDLERLFETNLSGTDVFGGISAAVEGTVDLNPQLSRDTLVSTVNGGSGIGSNPSISVSVTVGSTTESSVIDLSQAVTMADIARLIEEGAPSGTTVTVEVTGDGLVLHTDAGTISVAEVAEGRTARMLGILSDPDVAATDTITGTDSNVAMLKTTRLADLLGTKAQGLIDAPGANNDIRLRAALNGTQFNGTVELVGGGTAGSELVTYNAGTNTLTIAMEDGVSTAADVAAAITAEGTFTADIDYHDATSTAQAGTETIELGGAPSLTFTTAGGGGDVLDTTSGLVLTNGGESTTLDISDAETVEELLNLINGAGLGFLAEINASATGINVRSRISGADFTIGENAGTTATQLGIRTYNDSTELAAFNRGIGVPTASNPANHDLVITARDGAQLTINLSTATTVQDVIDLINNDSDNNSVTGTAVLARLASVGNGIELVDTSTAIVGNLIVEAANGSKAAEYLGFVPAGQTQATAGAPEGYTLQSEDRHTLETDSVFNTLLRLKTALETGNVEEIGRSLERLDNDIDRVNFARAEIGGRLRNLEVIELRLEDENVQLRAALSEDLDVDLVEAISNLTARQFAFEASLRSAGSLMQLSLLNFI
jgi:flagellar hook-associated protein 3